MSSMTAPFFFYLFTGDGIKPKKNLKNHKVFVNSACIIRRSMFQYQYIIPKQKVKSSIELVVFDK